MSCFGHPTIETPNLDQMAHEGMKLTQFYVAASICTPSRAGLLTGKLPAKIGMSGARSVLFLIRMEVSQQLSQLSQADLVKLGITRPV